MKRRTELLFSLVGFNPDWAVHPGQTLHELLTESGISQVDAATACGVSQKHMSRVITGKAGIGPEFAVALERFTHVDAHFWLRYQADWDLHRYRAAMTKEQK